MQKIDPEEYRKRLDRITSIYTNMMARAEELSTYRCPYKNRLDECTAKFGCRNQRKPKVEGGLFVCGGDDKLDYRTAWETASDLSPEGEETSITEQSRPQGDSQPAPAGFVEHGGERRGSAAGRTIFDYADELAVQVPTSCGRTGHCHECIVEIARGADALTPPTADEEFLRPPYRLACQARILDADVDVLFEPLRRTPKILTESKTREIEIDPTVVRRGDAVVRRDGGDEEVIDQFRGHLLGLAIDVGTTTVVMDLIDLQTGASVTVSSFENPQRFGGSDVMHRISYDEKHGGELRKALVNALNHEILALSKRLEFTRQEIYEIVIAGNSTMREILFRIDVQSIGQRPYKSPIESQYVSGERDSTVLVESTRKLGLRANPKARAYGMPLIASHVGADTAAALAAVGATGRQGVFMLVDVGTNTEVVVSDGDRMVAASCPAGPAFEGGLIEYGMPGYDGAIESVQFVDGAFHYSTIGGMEPQGICGSGLIDLLAELRRHDRMTPKGVFADKAYELSIVPERGIRFTREDASNLAQAKAANFCGQFIVLRHLGIDPEAVDHLFLAGGFANYVDVENAIEIGFLAPVPGERISKVGNAAVQGAREVLLSRARRAAVERMVTGIEHLELETTPDFFEVFVEGCQFKPMPAVLSQATL